MKLRLVAIGKGDFAWFYGRTYDEGVDKTDFKDKCFLNEQVKGVW